MKLKDAKSWVGLIGLAAFVSVGNLSAGTVNFANGNPGDWSDSGTGNPITVTTVGTGGPSGAGYTELPNLYPTAWQDNGPYTFYGASGFNTSPMQSVSQSIAVYLNPSLLSEQSGQFMLDMTPDATVNNSIYGTPQLWGAEQGFIVSGGAGGITATIEGGAEVATISSAGWYDFQITWSQGASGTDPVNIALSITDLSTATLVGSTTATASGSDPTTYESDYLGGSGYAWFTYWTPGFAGDILDVGDAETNGVPDSGSTMLLLGLGFLTLAVFGFRQNRLQVAK